MQIRDQITKRLARNKIPKTIYPKNRSSGSKIGHNNYNIKPKFRTHDKETRSESQSESDLKTKKKSTTDKETRSDSQLES